MSYRPCCRGLRVLELLLIGTSLLLIAACSPSNTLKVSGPNLGQDLPGNVPVLFAPGIVNIGMPTRDIVMTPDGKGIYFCLFTPRYDYSSILVTKLVDGHWTIPEVAPFSGSTSGGDSEPFITADGKQFYFCSSRPSEIVGSDGQPVEDQNDLWVMDRVGDSWGEPYNVGAPVCTTDPEFFPTVANNGTIYFCRADPQTRIHKIYRSRKVNGVYQEAELLPEQVNSGRNQFNAAVAFDESAIVVPVLGNPKNYDGVDYYVNFRDADDTWSDPINLGPEINTEAGRAWSPAFSQDGKSFFFMSSKPTTAESQWPVPWSELQGKHNNPGSGRSSVYWVSSLFLDELKNGVDPEETSIEPIAKTEPIMPNPGFPKLSGPYLGQKTPGMEPEVFAPGIVSTGLNERDLLISPDGREIWFGIMDFGLVTSMVTRLENGVWTEPVSVECHLDKDTAFFEPTLSADGNTVLFLANQAAPGQQQRRGWGNQNIFRSYRQDGKWTTPAALPAPITSDASQYYPSLATDGTMYYTLEDDQRNSAIWSAEPAGDSYAEPVRLPDTVNVGTNNYNAFVAQDESFIIMCVGGNEANLGPADYWISFRDSAGQWKPAVNMGETFNSPDYRAVSAFLSPDGKYLFFSTSRSLANDYFSEGRMNRQAMVDLYSSPGNGNSDIWWVDAKILQSLN